MSGTDIVYNSARTELCNVGKNNPKQLLLSEDEIT